MRLQAMTALSLLFSAGLLTACAAATPPPPRLITSLERVPVSVPAPLLTCEPAPAPPSTGTQRQVASYVVDLWSAGQDCRDKLGQVRGIVGQPVPAPP